MQEHRTLGETREMIVQKIHEAGKPLTRAGIAKAIRRKKTPHLIDIIDALVDDKILGRGVKTFHNGVQGYVYWLIEDPEEA
ncbi:MAG: hypothetical protein ACPG7F_15045 [Aggregatilineales bacterium]